MTIKEIVERVSLNVNEQITDVFISIVKRTINDVYSAVSRKVEDSKTTDMLTVTDAITQYKLPADAFLLNEVKFLTSPNEYLFPREVTEEELVRQFGEDTGGRILYAVSNRNDGVTIKWFPSFNGNIIAHYSVIPSFLDNNTSTDSVVTYPHSFFELLVYGCTHRYLQIKMLSASSEVQLYAMRGLIDMYKAQYEDALKDYSIYLRKTISTPIISPFNFSDDTMVRI